MATRTKTAETTEAPSSVNGLEAFIKVFETDWADLPLETKLAKISGYVSNVPKKGFNKAMGYRFARESDLVETIKPYLTAAGIHIAFSVESHEVLGEWPGKGVFPYILSHIAMAYDVSDGKSHIRGKMDGYGADAGDKGIYKAITGAKKYILMTLFMVDTGDDPEQDRKDERADARPYAMKGRVPIEPEHDKFTGFPPIIEEELPTITQTARTDIQRGGHTTTSTTTQKARLTDLAREAGIGRRSLLRLLRTELDKDYDDAPEADAAALGHYLDEALEQLSPQEMGKLIAALEEEPNGP